MRKYENHCAGCPEGMGCLGRSCPYVNVPVYYCDSCNSEGGEYRMDGEDYCEECAKEYLKDVFNELSVTEKAEALDVDIKRIGDSI